MSAVQGKVKWFNAAKGYGFVNTLDNPNKDIFVHFSSIEMEGYKALKEGEDVEFEVVEGPKGPTAIEVHRSSDAA